MADIQGTCDERFEAVRALLETNLDSGSDAGASVAVTVDGTTVVDLWGGTIDTDTQLDVPWDRDTIINVWSTTKTMTSICCLMLADRGELDLHAPIATYWPEFAANGKERIATSHILSHSSGLSGWQEPMTPDDLFDWELATSRLAAQAPWWEPGTQSGYHALTQGYLLGEVVRRITGRTIGEFFADEIAGPVGADFHIGTGEEHDARVAHVIPPVVNLAAEEPDPESVAFRTLTNPPLAAEISETLQWRRAEIPAAGGHGNARAVARIHSVVACGGTANGVTLLSEAGCNRIFEEQVHSQDLVLPIKIRFGMGFGLPSPELPISANERACFWGGWGGSVAVIDLDARMSFAYMMNRMGEGTLGDDRGIGLLQAAYTALTG